MMIMSVAPPALRTVTETWRACSASGKKENHLCFSSFLQLQFFLKNMTSIFFIRPLPQTSKIPVPRNTIRQIVICHSNNISFLSNLPLYPINLLLLLPVPGSPLFCIFLKPSWLCFSNCNCALPLFSNGDCMQACLATNFFCWHQFDRYREHIAHNKI